MAEEFNVDGMLDMYLYENGQLLEQLEATTLDKKDDEKFDEDTINEFFRVMHTIKGSSGIMMYDNITEVAHKLEDIFYYLRESHPEDIPHMELVEHILLVSDFISGEFDKIKSGDNPDGNQKELVKNLEDFLKKIKHTIQEGGEELPEENVYVEPGQYYIAPAATESSRFYKIKIVYRSDTQMCNIRAYSTIYSLKEVAEDLLYKPEDIITNEESADVILASGFQILLQAQEDEDTIRELIDHCAGVERIDITECTSGEFLQGFEPAPIEPVIDLDSSVEKIEARSAAKEKEGEEAPEPEKPKLVPGDYVVQSKEPGKSKKLAKQQKEKKAAQQNFISVNVAKMDMLMDLIGEIVISQAVVLQNPDLKVPGLNLSNFQKAAVQLTKFTSELQDVIMSMRMMPLTNTFQKMNRIVFDTSRKIGKEMDLEIIGETTEVDKNIIEHISDPLMHLIRNSVDHGIELPEERISAGKNPRGKITLEAKNEGGKVVIIVKDDGGGMDPKKIYKKAKDNELVGNREFQDFSTKEIFQFITYPGFSTKEKVTELSGRGVGMDVVVKNIQAIGGRLDIESKLGLGSVFTLKIPLTLAIIEGIVMQVGRLLFVVETGTVKEFLSAREAKILTEPDGEEYVMVREECYPIIRLKERFDISDGEEDTEKGVIIILEHEDKQVCIFADKLIGEQEIVVKPIPSYIKKVDGLSGCTQLGDGSIALILDTVGLL